MIKQLRTLLALAILLISPHLFAHTPTKVACIGNSITYGVGVSDSLTKSYPAVLAGLLGSDYQVRAFAKSGSTLLNSGHRPYINEPVYKNALEYRPDIVLIHLGVNDTDPRNWPHFQDKFIEDYVSLINSFKAVNPSVRVLIAKITPITVYHPRFESGTNDWQLKIGKAIEVVAQATGASLIDYHTPLHPHPAMLPDAIHPNDEGAAIMASVAASAITGDYNGLQLSQMYSDNMVLQRDRPIIIKGIANTSDIIAVELAGRKATAKTNVRGEWQATLPAMSAGSGYTLKIHTKEKSYEFSNVAIGEVWLCSGQSNMAFTLGEDADGAAEITKANNPNIRLYNMKAAVNTNPRAWSKDEIERVIDLEYFAPTSWQTLSSQTSQSLSAIAYYMANSLYKELDQVPIGIIVNAVGGSPTESWVERETLEQEIAPILRGWRDSDFIQGWARGRAAENLANVSKSQFNRHPYEPSYLFESGIEPLDAYPIRGVMWYQGESNAHNIELHERLFAMLVSSWRAKWQEPELPFYFVQLSSINRPSWPAFRDSQRRLAEQIPHTAMVVSSDKGDSLDVHPRHKKDIGLRLARLALAEQYGHNITPVGPLFKSASANGSSVKVNFDHADGLHHSSGDEIIGFELARHDGLYYPAQATVNKDGELVIESKDVRSPRYIRYSWQPFSRANLVNGDKLPASTFKSKIK